jgi:hypothetical protein
MKGTYLTIEYRKIGSEDPFLMEIGYPLDGKDVGEMVKKAFEDYEYKRFLYRDNFEVQIFHRTYDY